MSVAAPAVVVLGAGPAGLGAALRLARRGFRATVIERGERVGGNAASFEIDGVPVDFGSHRLHPTCDPSVLADIRTLLGADLLERPRHGRIRLGERWIRFPLQPLNLLLSLPPAFAAGVIRDTLWRPRITPGPDTFASVLERGLGPTICRTFYFPYAEKIWGLPPAQLDAEQARRRVSAGSIARLAGKALGRGPAAQSRTRFFFYPRGGFGRISQAYCHAALAAGADLRLRTALTAVRTERGRVEAVVASGPDGTVELPTRHVLSTIPLPALARALVPAAPSDVRAAAGGLTYRAMILVYLVLATSRFSEFDAHYFPGSDVAISRLSEPKNYGLTDAPGTTVLCAEIPCATGDAVWRASDDELGRVVCASLARADLPVGSALRRVVSRRLSHAYPIYGQHYRDHFDRLDAWIGRIQGLLSLGRQGLFAHDNTHHTLAMAYAAVECLGDDGTLDGTRWAAHRRAFAAHVVED